MSSDVPQIPEVGSAKSHTVPKFKRPQAGASVKIQWSEVLMAPRPQICFNI